MNTFILKIVKYIFMCYISLPVQDVESARILFATGTPAPSHQKPFQTVWKELSLRGHEVHVITPIPLNDKLLVNLTEYSVGDVINYLPKLFNASKEKKQLMLEKPSFLTAFTKDPIATYIWTKMHEYVLEHKNTQALLNKNLKFDLVIVEWLFPTLAGLGAYYECPLVGISSLGAPTVALDTLGNPSHPLVAPDMNLPITRNMTFYERMLSTLYSVYVRIYYHLKVLPDNDKIVKKYLRNNLPYLGDIEKNVSLLLLNRNPVFHRPIPFLPNMIEIGGIKYPKAEQHLDSDLQNFLDSSKQGVIYFSFGSSFRTRVLDPKILKVFQDAFRAVPYDVLWKWDADLMENQPENVYLRKWLPQTAVLENPNVKLFIYQGGLQSSEEVIAAHKPIIGIPSHSDQTANVDTCVNYGMGKLIYSEELTIERLKGDIIEIIENEVYAENARRLDQLMSDQVTDGLSKAIWWIEYVIRTNGAKHLRSIAVDLPLWQYLMLEILGILIGVICLILLVLYFISKILFRMFLQTHKRKTE